MSVVMQEVMMIGLCKPLNLMNLDMMQMLEKDLKIKSLLQTLFFKLQLIIIL